METRRLLKLAIPLTLSAFLMVSCGRTTPGEGPEPLRPGESVPRDFQALLTFLTGDVLGLQAAEWRLLEIGAVLTKDDTIRSESDSFAELQFGDMAVIRVLENTTARIGDVFLQAGASSVSLSLEAGAILFKVSKLGGDERFSVIRDNAVVGVRGTEFIVSDAPDGGTLVAVGDGAVSVVAVPFDPALVSAGVADSRVRRLIEGIEKSALVVGQGAQVILDATYLDNAQRAFGPVEETLAAVANLERVDEETLTRLSDQLDAAVATTSAAAPSTTTVSPTAQARLESADGLRFVVVSGTDLVTPRPELVKVSVTVPDAEIYLGDRLVGTGAASGLFTGGEDVRFRVVPSQPGPTAQQNVGNPVVGRTSRSSSPLVNIFGSGNSLIVVDTDSTLIGNATFGRIPSPTIASANVVSGTVYRAGSEQLAVYTTGGQREQPYAGLDKNALYPFGRRPVPYGDGVVVPDDDGLLLYSPGREPRIIPVPGGSVMVPATSETRIYVINRDGDLLTLGQGGDAIPTSLTGEVPGLMTSHLGWIIAADKTGSVVGVDLTKGAEVWHQGLGYKATEGRVFDFSVGDAGVFLVAQDRLYGLGLGDGRPVFTTTQVTTPVLLMGTVIYYGTVDSLLVEADARTGSVLRKADVGERLTTRPLVAANGHLLIGSEKGNVLEIDLERMR